MSDEPDERVRVYDEHGEPHDIMLRTKSGRVLTEQDLWRLSEQAEAWEPDDDTRAQTLRDIAPGDERDRVVKDERVMAVQYQPQRHLHPGEHWRELIEHSGRANVVIALDLDITQKHLSQILVGRAMPSVHLVIAFAELMGVPIELLWRLQCDYVLSEAQRQRRADEHRR